ncbi:hypothetical protein WAI453_005581 [Rhynchosporium graminicola]
MQFNFSTALLLTMALGAIAHPANVTQPIETAPADFMERFEAAKIRLGLHPVAAREADPNFWSKVKHWFVHHNPAVTGCPGQGTGRGCSAPHDYCSCTYITTYQCICV